MVTIKTQSPFWRSDWFVGALVVLAVFFLNETTDLFGLLERRYYDFASTSTSRQPSNRVAIITIDDQSIANIGRWPWPRDIHAQLIDKLAAAHAKTIVYTTLFFEPQTDRGLVFLLKIKDALKPATAKTLKPAIAPNGLPMQVSQLIADAEVALNTDVKFAESMAKAGNVLVPSLFTLGDPHGRPDNPLPPHALKSALDEANNFSLRAIRGQQPIEIIGASAVGVGHLNQKLDDDGVVRREPLLVNYYGKAIPSISLLATANSLNLNSADIKLNGKDAVKIGKLVIKTDDSALMLPQFYKDTKGRPAFSVDSFYDVVSGKIPSSKYADKIVIVGATAAGIGSRFSTPIGSGQSLGEITAHTVSSILNEHFIVQPRWSLWVTPSILLILVAYLLTGLPRLSGRNALFITLGFFSLLMAFEFSLLSFAAMWLKLVFPAALLLIGHLAINTRRFVITEARKLKTDKESAETNRMMGLSLQSQGQPDMAFDRLRRVPFSDALMNNLNNLALDFERRRQFNKAHAVYEYMSSYDANHKGLQLKLNRVKSLSETVILGRSDVHQSHTMPLDDSGIEKPMLGRYQVEKEIGKGAMGVVYLGKDSKIGRMVAIKTMALSMEFEGEELHQARARFFREAETAGRLQHQNIVTIFDAGEEHDLAFIAMEFLKGDNLSSVTRDGQLMPVSKVLSIVAIVSEALAYAHRQNVVHRDIKPANIMYDLESDTVKVTDFGIARITDSSKTRSGFILGTPSFMSPEQIAGKVVDGRSDLYSLGVMLFQMLTGVLPFRGDSIAALTYKIANSDAPDIHAIRNNLPIELTKIFAMALAKEPHLRYQDGDDFALDLRNVILKLSEKSLATAPLPVVGLTHSISAQLAAPSSKSSVSTLYDAKQIAMTNEVTAFHKTVVMPKPCE